MRVLVLEEEESLDSLGYKERGGSRWKRSIPAPLRRQ